MNMHISCTAISGLILYLFTVVTFVFYDASVGRARAAASARDELG